jgi:hypothetical protein
MIGIGFGKMVSNLIRNQPLEEAKEHHEKALSRFTAECQDSLKQATNNISNAVEIDRQEYLQQLDRKPSLDHDGGALHQMLSELCDHARSDLNAIEARSELLKHECLHRQYDRWFHFLFGIQVQRLVYVEVEQRFKHVQQEIDQVRCNLPNNDKIREAPAQALLAFSVIPVMKNGRLRKHLQSASKGIREYLDLHIAKIYVWNTACVDDQRKSITCVATAVEEQLGQHQKTISEKYKRVEERQEAVLTEMRKLGLA